MGHIKQTRVEAARFSKLQEKIFNAPKAQKLVEQKEEAVLPK
jgi:hypothetical protein